MMKRGSDQDRRGESLLDQRIVKSVQIGGLTVVLLDSDDFKEGDPMVGRNIVAFDEDGKIAGVSKITGSR